MAAVFARSGGRMIASAAMALSSQFPSSAMNAENNNNINNDSDQEQPGAINNQPFKQLSSKEVSDAARTIFGGKNESNNNNNNNHNNTNNNTNSNNNNVPSTTPNGSSIQVYHHSLPPLALALGQQLAEDPKIQQTLYDHWKEKWSIISSKSSGIEKEINLSDAEDEEFSGIHSPIISDIEADDWSHLSRNQLILSPELFAMAHQSIIHEPEGVPSHNHINNNHNDNNVNQQQSYSDSKNNNHLNNNNNNNNNSEHKSEGDVGIFDRFVRWFGSFFTPLLDTNAKTDQQNNNNHQSSSSSSSSNISNSSSSSSSSSSTDPPSGIRRLLGNVEIYQMAIAVAAVIVFVAIFRRPPPKF